MTTDLKTLWTDKLTESRTALFEFLKTLSPDQWQTPVFSEGDTWTITSVLAHLVENERGMSIHVHRIRKGEPTVPEDFDLTRWNAGVNKRMGSFSPEELMDHAVATRAKTLEVMASLQPEEWSLTGRHPSRGEITVEQYYETMAFHELDHLEDMKKAIRDA